MVPPKFLFITPLTPSSMMNEVRYKLHQAYLNALDSQLYSNWEVLLVGEEEKTEGKKTYLKCSGITKGDKIQLAYTYINSLPDKPEYLIRLDDDDIISPMILEKVRDIKFDCYADKYHSFYDLNSGLISQQKRDWLPNTVIHKMEHALQIYGEENKPLFTLDHSKYWHEYYRKKKVKWARKSHPVYLRILSETSITANRPGSNESSENYKKYLSGFGRWKKKELKDFSLLQLPQL